MLIKNFNKMCLTFLMSGLFFGCDSKLDDSANNNAAMSVVSANLKAVQNDYVPESIKDNGDKNQTAAAGAPASSAISSDGSKDICAGLDFTACQPRLIRAYLLFGQAAVFLTEQMVEQVAQDLAQTPNNSSGTVQIPDKNLTIQYKKRSLLDYDFLILSGNIPVGRVSASPTLYDIQLDAGVLDQGKPGSRGGKLDIQVNFTDITHWHSQITVTDMSCNVKKPDDPTSARISVTRNADMWSGQSMFYNGIAGALATTKTCSLIPNDNTGLAIYTDFVADHIAAKAALYMMKRSEANTASIQNFGFNGLCNNYSDLCQALATSGSTTPSAIAAYLAGMSNPYCVQRGTSTVTFNSDCHSLSPNVASQAFLPNANWIAPSVFYQMSIVIPPSL